MNQVTKVADVYRNMGWDDSFGSGIAGAFNAIGYASKYWTLKYEGTEYPFRRENGEPSPHIDVILIAANPAVSKVYYEGAYEQGQEGRVPDCASMRADVPDSDVPNPQSKTCALCEHNKWAQQPNGRRGKACQDHKKMAVLLLPSVTEEMIGSQLNEPVALKIPPGSFGTLKKYLAFLKDRQCPAFGAITRIGFTPGENFQMSFQMVQMLEGEEAELIKDLRESETTMRLIGTDQPAVRQLEEVPFDPPKRIETGIKQAFAKKPEAPAPKPIPAAKPKTMAPAPKAKLVDTEVKEGSTPGRRAAKAIQELEHIAKTTTVEEVEVVADEGEGESFEASDQSLDERVQAMMANFTKK